MVDRREAWITGIGLISSLGEGLEAHRSGFAATAPKLDSERFAPYQVHPMAALDLDKQIPKKGDQRQMEPWQRFGTYAAGLALEDAGVKGNADILSRTHMICAAGGGERDNAVDVSMLQGLRTAPDRDKYLTQRLSSDLRPTLFLAQLSNLLAGNISIVHGVVGSSRTFMGEEQSGVDATRIALSRLEAGQGDIFLVGAAFNAEREDMLLLYELGGSLAHGPFAPVWNRAGRGGMVLGSLSAFLVIEEKAHAQARGARAYARLSSISAGRTRRQPGDVKAAVADHIAKLGPIPAEGSAVISGATGCAPVTGEEQAAIAATGLAMRGTATMIGAGMEAQFPANLALAAMAISDGALFAPLSADAGEAPLAAPLKRAIVTSVGHWRGEAAALVEAAI